MKNLIRIRTLFRANLRILGTGFGLVVLILFVVAMAIRARNQATDKLVHDLEVPGFAVMNLDWNPRGGTIAADLQGIDISFDRIVLVDTVTWNLHELVSGKESYLGDLSWSPDGRMLAIEPLSQPVSIVDISTGHTLTELNNSLRYSTIGWLGSTNLMLMGRGDWNGSVELIDVLTPESAARIDDIENMNAYRDQLCLRSISSMQFIGLTKLTTYEIGQGDLQGVCSPDSRYFASYDSQSGLLSVLDAELNQLADSFNVSLDLRSDQLAWSPTSDILMLVPQLWIWSSKDSEIRQLPIPDGTSTFLGILHQSALWSPDGSKFAILGTTAGSFETYPRDRILVWDVHDNQLIQTVFQDNICCISWNPTSDALAVGSRGHIKVWSITQ
jgi:WD40 repeat protein